MRAKVLKVREANEAVRDEDVIDRADEELR